MKRAVAQSEEEVLQCVRSLARRGPPLVKGELDFLLELLGDERKRVQKEAVAACGMLARASAPLKAGITRLVDSKSWRKKWGAVCVLLQSGELPPQAEAALLELIGVADLDTRWAAARGVKQLCLRVPAAARGLVAVARTGTSTARKMALYCLRDLSCRGFGAEQAVLSNLGAVDPYVRLAALSALARLATNREEASGRIALLLDDANSGVRRSAAAALGTLGECAPQALQALRQASQSDDPSLRRAAARSLRVLERAGAGPRGC